MGTVPGKVSCILIFNLYTIGLENEDGSLAEGREGNWGQRERW